VDSCEAMKLNIEWDYFSIPRRIVSITKPGPIPRSAHYIEIRRSHDYRIQVKVVGKVPIQEDDTENIIVTKIKPGTISEGQQEEKLQGQTSSIDR
jgi:hypothetical protein